MHSGLLTPAVPTSDPAESTLGTDLMITMLDGDLGAVTDPEGSAILPRSDAFCWCGCIVCFAPSEQPADGNDDLG
jgi:hypothetical protein